MHPIARVRNDGVKRRERIARDETRDPRGGQESRDEEWQQLPVVARQGKSGQHTPDSSCTEPIPKRAHFHLRTPGPDVFMLLHASTLPGSGMPSIVTGKNGPVVAREV
jgi:hypothetical protein